MAVDPFASDQDRPALSHTPSDPSPAAENAFWAAPEERRDKIRAAGLPFDERSHHPFREAHAERRLISGLVAGVARYKRGRGTPGRLPSEAYNSGDEGSPSDSGAPPIQPGEPWAPYVTPEAKRGARAAIADAEELIPFV